MYTCQDNYSKMCNILGAKPKSDIFGRVGVDGWVLLRSLDQFWRRVSCIGGRLPKGAGFRMHK